MKIENEVTGKIVVRNTTYIKHWTPNENKKYYFIDHFGYSVSLPYSKGSYDRLIENYNMFPTRELAEKAVNLSKLGRLILLWQYSNDCIFTPNWSDDHQPKYDFYYNNIFEVFEINFYSRFQSDLASFETREQAEAFIKMYSEEIKKIIGVE